MENMPQFMNETLEETGFCLYEPPIFLYPFSLKELYSQAYLQWMNDARITRTLGRPDYLMPVTREKLLHYYKGIKSDNTIFLAIYHGDETSIFKKDEQCFIGTLKILDIDFLSRRASIGIMIGDPENWGKGFATQSIGIVIKYLFDTLGIRKITAGYIAENKGMAKAFEKNGFTIEATFKKHIFFEGDYVDHVFVSKFSDKYK